MVSRNFDPATGNKGFGAVHKVLKFYSRTCIDFTSGGLIVSVILCDSQRQISFNSAVSVFLDCLIKKNSCSIPSYLIRIEDYERMPV